MFGWFVLTIIFVLIAFKIGQRRGAGKAPTDMQQRTALQEAWQKGYDDAVTYLRTLEQDIKPQQRPTEVAPAQSPPPVIPAAVPPVQVSAEPVPERTLVFTTGETAPPAKPAKVLSKRERELRNINITLYVAALMIVAAGALFLSFALAPVSKLVAFFLLTAAFYAGGLITYSAKESLRPAAAAFAGTGLALLPLCAIATYNTLDISGPLVWLVFSLIGTAAVGYATLKLKSRVLAWVAVLILVSTAMAGAATMQRGVLLYMLALLLLSVILMVLAVRSEKVRGSIFYTALSSTAQLLPVLVLVLCIVLFDSLSSREYFWIFALLTAQLLLTVRLLENLRPQRLYAARVSAMLMLIAGSDYLGFDVAITALIVALALASQAVLVLVFAPGYQRRLQIQPLHVQIERAILWVLSICALALSWVETLESGSVPGYSYVVFPLFMLLAVPGLIRRARLELIVAVLVPGLALAGADEHFWYPLPAVLLVILALSYTQRISSATYAQICGHLRWLLILTAAGLLGGSVQELSGAGHSQGYLLAVCAAALMALLLGWSLYLRSMVATADAGLILHHVIRLSASVVIAVALLASLRLGGALDESRQKFLNVDGAVWFIGALVLSTMLLGLTGLRIHTKLKLQGEMEHLSNFAVALVMAVFYALSFHPDYWVVTLLIGTGLLAYFVLSPRTTSLAPWKIAYASLAQLVFSSMIWWFVDRMNFDAHGRFALLLVSVLLPQLVRLIMSRKQAKPLRGELRGIAIAMLVGLPVATVVYSQIIYPSDRGVLLLTALLWGIYGVVTFRADLAAPKLRRQFYLLPSIGAAIFLASIPAWLMNPSTGWIHRPWWSVAFALSLLFVFSMIALVLEWRLKETMKFTLVTGAGIFAPALSIVAWRPGSWWEIAAMFLLAGAFVLLVHTRSSAWMALGASALLGITGLRAVNQMLDARRFYRLEDVDVFWTLLGVAVLLYLLAIFHGRMNQPVPEYPAIGYRTPAAPGGASRIYFAAMLIALLGAGAIAHLSSNASWSIIAGAIVLLGVAVLVMNYEVSEAARAYLVDALIVLTAVLALSSYGRIVQPPQFSSIAAYAIVVAVILVLWRNLKVDRELERIYLIVGAIFGSITLLASLAQSNSLAQVIALFFFAALVAWNLKLGDKLLIWWGAIAITLAILWFLRDLAFLWLVIIGLGLIAAAVYKLMRVDKQNSAPEMRKDDDSYPAQMTDKQPRDEAQ